MARKRKKKSLLQNMIEMSDVPSAADRDPSLLFKRSVLCREAYPEVVRDDGSPGCRRCLGPLPPRKRTLCSEPCLFDMLLRCNPAQAAYWVKLRDKGICALCGINTAKLKSTDGKRTWQSDHANPVILGGGHSGLNNYRLLCLPCHKAETAALAKRLAERRKLGK